MNLQAIRWVSCVVDELYDWASAKYGVCELCQVTKG